MHTSSPKQYLKFCKNTTSTNRCADLRVLFSQVFSSSHLPRHVALGEKSERHPPYRAWNAALAIIATRLYHAYRVHKSRQRNFLAQCLLPNARSASQTLSMWDGTRITDTRSVGCVKPVLKISLVIAARAVRRQSGAPCMHTNTQTSIISTTRY